MIYANIFYCLLIAQLTYTIPAKNVKDTFLKLCKEKGMTFTAVYGGCIVKCVDSKYEIIDLKANNSHSADSMIPSINVTLANGAPCPNNGLCQKGICVNKATVNGSTINSFTTTNVTYTIASATSIKASK
ncbi:uncharacterized protein LOC122499913 [Leptopilina heterotoma]|uniref:uncharacterized protein LOC122499913 n=1 Tax=Leptopilina heterotoma TaxID=63436 RepID=UPI001CA90FC9|nr:uncharacterized protein LOC122499913 [Leptopilina heterotoma]